MLNGFYSPWLVGLSFAIAVFTSTMALQVAGVAARIRQPWQRQLAVGSGAIALGGGTWSMHFVGMLAFDLCTPVHYDMLQTLVSLLPSLAASWVALHLLARSHISPAQLVMGGVLLGAGIGAMHYSGMAAMQMAPALRYDPAWFVLSILVAVGLATLALWIRFGLRGLLGARWLGLGRVRAWQILLASGCVMGLAIACMHYMGMLAARFVAPPGFIANGQSSRAHGLALAIALIAVMLTMLIALGVTAVLRYRQVMGQVRASESRLQASEQQYRSLLRHTPGMTFRRRLLPTWPLVFISEGALAVTGWRAQDFMADTVVFRELIFPEDAQRVGPLMQRAMDEHTPYESEFRIRHRSGQLRWVMSRGSVVPVDQGAPLFFDGLIMDITDRKLAEQARQHQEQQFSSLIRNIPGIAVRFMTEGRMPLRFISEAVEAMTGWPADAFLRQGKGFEELIYPPDLAAILVEVHASIREHRSYSIEYRICHRDGHMFWAWGRGAATYDTQGNPLWIDGIVLDIQERREMQDALVAAKDRAELAATSKSAFLANMSHEIRTPMNAIIGFTEVLLGSELSLLQRRHMGTVRQSARSLLELLNDILDTAKLEKGALELEHTDFCLEALAIQVLDTLRLGAEAKGLALELHYQVGLGKYFKGDALRVQQVLSNLVGNAVKFTAQGHVRLDIFDDAGQVHLAVRDSGIAADRIEKIFDSFSQADASMSRRFGGTGLGTTIARQLVQLMQGTLWVTSTLGEGSDFHVRLPLCPGAEVHTPPEVLLYQLPPLCILVVDDVVQNLELLELVLGKAGHQVVMAADGAQALAAWQAGYFDVVLMDVQMPGMDGLEATRCMRGIEQERGLRATPVIALTASVLEQHRVQTHDAGMDGFASKPIELDELLREIARVIGVALPEQEGATVREIRQASTELVVDWTHGATLWGNHQKQGEAIRRLLTENQDLCVRLGQLLDQAELDAAHQLVHRLRGAAGNLCLRRRQAHTAAMEDALRARDRELAASALPQLQTCLAEVWDALSVTPQALGAPAAGRGQAPPAAHSEGQQTPVPADAMPLHSAAFGQLAQAMVQALRHGELDDAGLQQLSQALRAAGQHQRAQALENEVDAFEFQRAEQLITELL